MIAGVDEVGRGCLAPTSDALADMVTIIILFANGAVGVVPSLPPLPHPRSKKSEDENISILFFMNIKILAW